MESDKVKTQHKKRGKKIENSQQERGAQPPARENGEKELNS